MLSNNNIKNEDNDEINYEKEYNDEINYIYLTIFILLFACISYGLLYLLQPYISFISLSSYTVISVFIAPMLFSLAYISLIKYHSKSKYFIYLFLGFFLLVHFCLKF